MEKNNPPPQSISMNIQERARLFFALWPDIGCMNQLAETGRDLAKVCGGRSMRSETLHMTLLFIGSVARPSIPGLEAAAASVRFPRFDFRLEHLACWKHNKIAYAAPDQAPEALMRLAAQLRSAVDETGIEFDRKAFNPHVTLLRNIERNFSLRTIPPLVWSVSSYALVESVPTERGVRYRNLKTWTCMT